MLSSLPRFAGLLLTCSAFLAAGCGSDEDVGSVIGPDGSVASWALGTPDATATLQVLDLSSLTPEQLLAPTPGKDLLERRTAVLDLGPTALHALGNALRSGGCSGAPAAELVGVLGAISGQKAFGGAQGIAVTDLLLEVAVGTPEPRALELPGFPALVASLDPAGEGSAAAIEAWAAGLGAAEKQAARELLGQRLCLGRSLDTVRSLPSAHRIGRGDLLPLVERRLAQLKPGSPLSIDLIGLLHGAAPEDREWATRFEELTLDDSLAPAARGLACEAAIQRRSRMEQTLPRAAELPEPVLECLMQRGQSREWWSADLPRQQLLSPTLSVRLAAIASLGRQAEGQDVERLLARLQSPDPKDPPPTLRETAALRTALSDILRVAREHREDALAAVEDPALAARLRAGRREEGEIPVSEQLAEALCDRVLSSSESLAAVGPALEELPEGAALCLGPGEWTGSLQLQRPGGRLLVLGPSVTTLRGDLVVQRPSVVFGLHVLGSVLVAPEAEGSILAALQVDGAVALGSPSVLLAGVRASEGLHSAWGGADSTLTLPPDAQGLLVRLTGQEWETHGQRGAAGAWHDLASLDGLYEVSRWTEGHSRPDLLVLGSPGTPWEWLGEGGLALPRPARSARAPRDRWVPVYGPGEPVPDRPALAVPLTVGSWHAQRADLMFTLRRVVASQGE